jgi:hypothetical protein
MSLLGRGFADGRDEPFSPDETPPTMTPVVPPPLAPLVLGKTAQQQARSTAVRTDTPKAVRRIYRIAHARPTEEQRLPDPPQTRGRRLDVSA